MYDFAKFFFNMSVKGGFISFIYGAVILLTGLVMK